MFVIISKKKFKAMEDKIEKLEKRIEELEGKKVDETEDIDG